MTDSGMTDRRTIDSGKIGSGTSDSGMSDTGMIDSSLSGSGLSHTGATMRGGRVPVFVVLPPRTLLLDVAGPLDVLRRANMVQQRITFDVRYIGPARSVVSSIGLELTGIHPLPRAGTLPADAIVVIAGSVDEIMRTANDRITWASARAGRIAGTTLMGRAAATRGDDGRRRADDRRGTAGRQGADDRRGPGERGGVGDSRGADDSRRADDRDDEAIVEWLRASIRPEHLLVSICSGALLAARAGLLDGYACTTHYVNCADLAGIAPHARVLENRLYVEDRQRLTSAGVTAGIDLMLHIVSRFVDHACALAVARYLVVYMRRGGADPQLSPWLEGRNHLHPAIHRVQDAVAADPARDWTLGSLARIAGASSRHLSRLFNEHAGMSITEYRNRLRVALARELLGHTRLDMEHVAERAGFASPRQLRRAWRQFYPTPPRQARTD
jgi:transcriptional regulator GlxA family with amidase domain